MVRCQDFRSGVWISVKVSRHWPWCVDTKPVSKCWSSCPNISTSVQILVQGLDIGPGVQILVWLSAYSSRCPNTVLGPWILAQVPENWSRCPYISSDVQILVCMSVYWLRCVDISSGDWILLWMSIHWSGCLDIGQGFQTLTHVHILVLVYDAGSCVQIWVWLSKYWTIYPRY